MILGLVLALSVTAEATETPTFLDIARNADGSVMYLSQADAAQYCSTQGAHLPSARELGQLSRSLGANGIAEVASGMPDDSYYLINATNADGTADNFYFSDDGYQQPADDLGNNFFWSSSVDSNGSGDAYVLAGDFGDLGSDDYAVNISAIRCVSGR